MAVRLLWLSDCCGCPTVVAVLTDETLEGSVDLLIVDGVNLENELIQKMLVYEHGGDSWPIALDKVATYFKQQVRSLFAPPLCLYHSCPSALRAEIGFLMLHHLRNNPSAANFTTLRVA